MRLRRDFGERERLEAARGEPAVDEAHVLDADVEAEGLALAGPDRHRRREEAEAEDDVGRLGGRLGVDMGAVAGGGVLADVEHEARVLRRLELALGGDRERVVGRGEAEHAPRIEVAEPHVVRGGAELLRDADGKRGGDAGADLDRLRGERDAAGRVDLDQREGGVGARAVFHRHAGKADAVELVRRRGRAPRLLGGAAGPERLRRQPVEHLGAPHIAGDDVAEHRPPAVGEQVAAAELDRVEAEARRRLVDQHLERGHGLEGAEAAHRAGGDGAAVAGERVHVDLWHVVHADRRRGADERHRLGEVGEAAAVEVLVRGEGGDPAARLVDGDLAPDREGVTLDARTGTGR